MLNATWFVLRSELLLHLRRSHEWLHPLGFFIIIVSLFPLAFTPDPVFLQKYVPGCIWIGALLASLLSVQNVFLTDLEDGHLEQLILSPSTFTLLIFVKLSAQWLITELPLILLTPLLGWMFHLSFAAILVLCISLFLGTPILTLLGSLGVALTLGLRQQGVLIGLLFLPLVTPILIFGVTLIQQLQTGLPILGPLAFLAGLSLLAITFLPFVIAASLKIGIDD